MSHFYTVVLLRPEQARDIESSVANLLVPFDENMEVAEYDRPCHCIGDIAHSSARRTADEAAGTFDSLRESFYAKHPWPGPDASEEEHAKNDALWRTHIAPRVEAEKTAFEAHPLRDEPDASCEDCRGSGTYRSTRNPQAKWDWWQIGGRWTGTLGEYDPEKDPANIETCDLCHGTGKRRDMVVAGGCNGCRGEGRRVKWPTSWRAGGAEVGNVAPALEILKDDKRIPFAIVTPDGAWSEKGKMGWFGCVSDAKGKDDWRAQARQIVEAHADCTAVVIDCHI